jgi:hypothetical protein
MAEKCRRSLMIASILIAAGGCYRSSDRDPPADQKASIPVTAGGRNQSSKRDTPADKSSMLGSWKRLHVIGAWTGHTTYYPPGEEHVTIFERDSTYCIVINGQMVEDGRYSISHINGRPHISYPVLNRSEYYAHVFGWVWVRSDTLHISGLDYDAPEYVYVRLS